MGALKLDWLARWAGRRRHRPVRRLLVASRDLPPIDAGEEDIKGLPRSPDPLSETELVFAYRAAGRMAQAREAMPMRRAAAPGLMLGKDLRSLLERFEQDCARHEARVMPGRPALRLVTAGMPVRESGTDMLTPEADAALVAALDTLRKLSALARR